MQVHSIISNTISEEILQTGHISIRLLADGFSFLLEDKNYRPVLINRFQEEFPCSVSTTLAASEDWMNRHTLLESFTGESTIVISSASSQLIPHKFFNKDEAEVYLGNQTEITASQSFGHAEVYKRPFVINYSYSSQINEFAARFKGKIRIIPSLGVLLSLADQIDSADHQRGFCLIEVQEETGLILCVKDDQVLHTLEIQFKEKQELYYHTLNVFQQIGFSPESTPAYLSGQISEELIKTYGKYIRKVALLNYFIQGIDKKYIPEHSILAEATKCE